MSKEKNPTVDTGAGFILGLLVSAAMYIVYTDIMIDKCEESNKTCVIEATPIKG
jgi:hypothetical protein